MLNYEMPAELLDYLQTLISPPDSRAVWIGELSELDMTEFAIIPDSHLYGVIARGTPTEAQSAELMRVLRPGAHLLLVAPNGEPWGASGVCSAEDAGFEVRDAISVLVPLDKFVGGNAKHRFFYCPKAGSTEREFGCEKLPIVIPTSSDGEGRRNPHPTVKPLKVMRSLLGDIPKRTDVLYDVMDPFLGSGTTAIACALEGHSFVGIERDQKYSEVAVARAKAWTRRELIRYGMVLPEGWRRPCVVVGDEVAPAKERPIRILTSDCFDAISAMPEASVGAVVADPPYGLEFMGKHWDAPWREVDQSQSEDGLEPVDSDVEDDVPVNMNQKIAFQEWAARWLRECYRVVVPRGVVKVFGGTRMYHRLAKAMVSAGFEIEDLGAWCYGGGMPKGLNIYKALLKAGHSEAEASKWKGYNTGLKPSWEPILIGVKR